MDDLIRAMGLDPDEGHRHELHPPPDPVTVAALEGSTMKLELRAGEPPQVMLEVDLIARLKALEAAATRGPWERGTRPMETNVVRPKGQFDWVGVAGSRFDLPTPLFTHQVSNISRQEWEANAALIAESRNALPGLLCVAEAAEKLLRRFEATREPTATLADHEAFGASIAELERALEQLAAEDVTGSAVTKEG